MHRKKIFADIQDGIGEAVGTFFSKRENVYLLAILVFAAALSLFLFKGMSTYGDDAFYTEWAPSILNGMFRENVNLVTLRLLVIVPMALSIKLFGYTDFGAGAWTFFCYLATVLITYQIGKETYSKRAGLIAALLFSIYPLSLHFNTSPDPMMPVSMFLSLSVLFFIYGRKRNSVKDYLISGYLGFAAVITHPLAYLYFAFYGFYIVGGAISGSIRKRKPVVDYHALTVFVGLLTGLVVMGYINIWLANGSPFIELNLTNSYYSAAGGPNEIYYTNPSLTFYIDGYFPYGFMNNVLVPLVQLNPQGALSGMKNIASEMFSYPTVNLNDVGLFSYFVVVAYFYVLAKRDRKTYFTLLWMSFIVGYMEFGSMSITHYFPIYKLMRFTAIAAVPLMLTLGIALSDVLGDAAGERKRAWTYWARIFAVGGVIVLLLATSLPMDYYYYSFNHNNMLYVKAMASALGKAQLSGANVLTASLVYIYLNYYLGYPNRTNIYFYDNGANGGTFLPTCASIPNNTYLIIPSAAGLGETRGSYQPVNESWAYNPQSCNLRFYAQISNSSKLGNIYLYDQIFTGNIYYKA